MGVAEPRSASVHDATSVTKCVFDQPASRVQRMIAGEGESIERSGVWRHGISHN